MHSKLAAWGCHIELDADDETIVQRLRRELSYLWTSTPADEAAVVRAKVRVAPHGRLTWICGDDTATVDTIDELAQSIASPLERAVAEHCPTHVFIHAGVVAWKGRAIVLPGRTLAGKSTATLALVRAGATYYSDEYAPIDAQGMVHSFARPLRRRDDEGFGHPIPLSGGGAALELGSVVFAYYCPGAAWEPERISMNNAVLRLVEHAVSVRADPRRALEAIGAALTGAVAVGGDRGEADAFAQALLASL